VKVTRAESWVEHFPLSRPYTIAFRSVSSVDNVIVRIETDTGLVGLGAGAPEPFVTGETPEACREALAGEAIDWLHGRDARTLPLLCRELARRIPAAPAARAAVDGALHDVYAQALGLPLVEVLGRAHDSLPTSITIGIKPVAETVAEAREYVGRGFTVLKVKGGHSLEEDCARLRAVREEVGPGIAIRVDPNQGYRPEEVIAFMEATRDVDIEFLEQPTPARDGGAAFRSLPETVRTRIAADESLLTEEDALRLAAPPRACGIFNIKLMKCGGIHAARGIARIAAAGGIDLMWGCMDESIISITAALHAALASPATRYLDLDGSFDLARDIVTGGFELENGRLRTRDAPGLGVTLCRV
jgi:L-alanine-DL-glutamate epimerase-like enolase superfamily enzyme